MKISRCFAQLRQTADVAWTPVWPGVVHAITDLPRRRVRRSHRREPCDPPIADDRCTSPVLHHVNMIKCQAQVPHSQPDTNSLQRSVIRAGCPGFEQSFEIGREQRISASHPSAVASILQIASIEKHSQIWGFPYTAIHHEGSNL